MSKQRHDQGYKKRQHAANHTPADKDRTTEHLAAELVRRRLASNLILDRGQAAPTTRRDR